MQIHAHPHTGTTIEGVRLLPGSIIREGDQYDSSSGVWETGDHMVGSTIRPGCKTIWVRRIGHLSDDARNLLARLNSSICKSLCLGQRHNNIYLIPRPTFNWDGRIDWGYVQNPACVQELVDHGYLVFGEYEVVNWMSEYSTVGDGHKNQVYILTDEGKREGARLLVG